MLNLNETYVLNKKEEPVAVQLSLKSFTALLQVLEDAALLQCMNGALAERKLSLEEAKTAYAKTKS